MTAPASEHARDAANGSNGTNEQKHATEAAFFDDVAERAAANLAPFPPETIARYANPRRRYMAAEFRFAQAGAVAGKRVLDVGCGLGQASVLLAQLGATVTGLDVSPGSIDVARAWARKQGVDDRTSFVCAPIETVDFAPGSFDVIWSDAFLHHVIDALPLVLRRFREWTAPGGTVIMTEPVSLSPAVRAARLKLFPQYDHTPDERPLEPAEIALVRETFADVRIRYFDGLSRLDRFVLPDHRFEQAPPLRRAASMALHRADWALLALPGVQKLAGMMVATGRVPLAS